MKPESPKPTVRQEAILVAVAVTIAMAVGVLDAMFSPTFAGFKAPRLVIMAVLWAMRAGSRWIAGGLAVIQATGGYRQLFLAFSRSPSI